MERTIIGLLLCVFVFTGQSFGQTNEFNLSDYKLPDLKRHSLEMNYALSTNNNFINYSDLHLADYNEHSNNQFGGIVNINYNFYLNTPSKQQQTSASFNFSSSYSNLKEDKQLVSKNSNFAPRFYYKTINRKYYNPNHFFEVDFDLNYQFSQNKYFNDNNDQEYNSDLRRHNFIGFIPLKIGIGRIEPIQDARQAVYLFDELAKQNRITSNKSKEEIIKFAELISKLKNERFFDSRLKRIAELEAIDSFLVANNYVNNSDARYFTTLSDFWEFGDRPQRNSGSRLSASINPGYYYSYNKSEIIIDEIEKVSLNGLMLNGGFEYKREKPISLNWQNTIDLIGFAGILEVKRNEYNNSQIETLNIPSLQFGLSQQFGYYPNTRTDINLGYSLQYIQLFDKSDIENNIVGGESIGLYAKTFLSVNYYISPKFRLNISSLILYSWQDTNSYFNSSANYFLAQQLGSNDYDYHVQKAFSNKFNVSLLYSIF